MFISRPVCTSIRRPSRLKSKMVSAVCDLLSSRSANRPSGSDLVQREGVVGVECLPAAPPQPDAIRAVDRATAVHGAKGGFPAHEVHHVSAQALREAAVHQAGRRLEIVDQSLPESVLQFHDGSSGVARCDRDLAAARLVAIGVTALAEAEGE